MMRRTLPAAALVLVAALWIVPPEGRCAHPERGPQESLAAETHTASLPEARDRDREPRPPDPAASRDDRRDEPGELEKRLSELMGASPSPEPAEPVFSSPQRQLSQRNPEISILGDFWALLTNEEDLHAHEHEADAEADADAHEHAHALKDGFRLSEVEIAIQAPLDPFSSAKFILGLHDDEIHAEEAYVHWTNLPARLQLKLGRFFANFGTINRWHPHAYPTADTPPALESVFGDHPFGGVGGSLTVLLPPFMASYNELDLEIVNGDNERAFAGEGYTHPVGVIHFKSYYDLDEATYFEFGISGAAGENDPDLDFMTTMEGLDLALVWSPPERQKYRGIEARGELFFTQRDTPEGTRSSLNALSFVEAKVNRRWTGGVRLDYVEDTALDTPSSYGGAAFMTFWQSEFVRLRFEYSGLNLERETWRHRGIVQVTFALGPHKHEKY